MLNIAVPRQSEPAPNGASLAAGAAFLGSGEGADATPQVGELGRDFVLRVRSHARGPSRDSIGEVVEAASCREGGDRLEFVAVKGSLVLVAVQKGCEGLGPEPRCDREVDGAGVGVREDPVEQRCGAVGADEDGRGQAIIATVSA